MVGGNILVLDDDPDQAGLYAAIVRKAGLTPIIHTHFESARMHLRHYVPDGLLTDVRVAEYNGIHLAILFRSVAPDAPIVVVSGYEDPVIRQEVAKLNAEFFLKPLSVDRLARCFDRSLNLPEPPLAFGADLPRDDVFRKFLPR